MNYKVVNVRYDINAEPVTIGVLTPAGDLTYLRSTQTALNAKRPDPSKTWWYNEARAVAYDLLSAQFPGVSITVVLYEP